MTIGQEVYFLCLKEAKEKFMFWSKFPNFWPFNQIKQKAEKEWDLFFYHGWNEGRMTLKKCLKVIGLCPQKEKGNVSNAIFKKMEIMISRKNLKDKLKGFYILYNNDFFQNLDEKKSETFIEDWKSTGVYFYRWFYPKTSKVVKMSKFMHPSTQEFVAKKFAERMLNLSGETQTKMQLQLCEDKDLWFKFKALYKVPEIIIEN